ncbi:MAG TPA: glycosyltransferase family 4 protein [Ignavibacteriaceae bacterium]|nr:glycosyltransferase family 4 protein [Ignavibacteriaceae bacterium]
MKIALIGRYGEGEILPGPERVARELYLNLRKKNSNIFFIEYFFSGYKDYFFINKIFGKKLREENIFRLGIIPIIITLLKEQFDIIHFVNSQRVFLVIFFLKPFLKAKYISTIHGLAKAEVKNSNIKRAFLDLRVEEKLLNKSNLIVFPSKYLFDLFTSNYTFNENKCRVIHNGISEVFVKNKIRFEKKEIYNFVYFNSFNKGLNELLNKLSQLKLPIKIFIIGKEERIENQNKNIEINFIQPMEQSSLLKFLSDKHFIIKSEVKDLDAFSTIAIECMSMGIIPIVSENTGVKEIIENKINGFVYHDSEENLSTILENIYEDKFNLKQISENTSKIYEKLNWEKVSDEYLQQYKTLV